MLAAWEAPPSTTSPAAAPPACWASSDSPFPMTRAHPTDGPGSSASRIGSIRLTCRCYAVPTSSGASSRLRRVSRSSSRPEASTPARPIRRLSPAQSARVRSSACEHEIYDGASVRTQFPGYQLPSDFVALYQPQGGVLLPERCITAHVAAAQRAGADVRVGETVVDWRERGDAIDVRTDRGTYSCRQLLVSAGAWTGQLPTGLQPLLSPERQVMLWTQPRRPEVLSARHLPGRLHACSRRKLLCVASA